MLRNLLCIVGIALALALAGTSPSASGADEQLVLKFLSVRQALVQDKKLNIAEMSQTIRAAINEGERLERAGDYQSALGKILELEKYCPLGDMPSFDVHMLSSWLYGKLGDSNKASFHRSRADAMRELLSRRIGTGETPVDPIRAVMINDITEWTRSRVTRVVEVKSHPHQGKELHAITYSGLSTGGQAKIAYFEIDPRVQAVANQQIRQYAAIPLSSMRPQDLAAFEHAKQKRERFLTDDDFPYLELLARIRDSIKAASELATMGKHMEAISKLKEIEAIRPIEDIPLPDLIGAYSFLNGRVGDTQKQGDLRRLLFGINQAIAHSGDGLSPETAVHVVATTEEYNWVRDQKLTVVKQRVVDTPNGKFDVLSAKDVNGLERDFYFNITRMYSRYDLTGKKTKP